MRAAIYCRVSSDRQEHEETIQSQLAELRVRATEDDLAGCPEFLDEGFSRDNLVRPNLDHVRDLATTGELDRLYVQCPDRLASGAKLIILVEELQQHGAEVVFLKGAADDTPEGKLLLHLQGAIAEYERTKIAERTRRGKLYWAKQGAIVSGHSPYGYRFVRRSDTTRAGLEVDDAQAAVVRDIYRWLIDERMSTRAIAHRLNELGVPTAAGARQWQPTVVHRILRNPVHRGAFQYHKYERVVSQHRRSADQYRQHIKNGRRLRPEEEWIPIPVRPIIDPDTWQAAQEQLKKNCQLSARNNTRHDYLLRGLFRCHVCGGSNVGHFRNGKRYYECRRTDSQLSSTGQKCAAGSRLAEPIELAVWEAIAGALKQPQVLIAEYQRRIVDGTTTASVDVERKQLALAQKKVKAQEDRLTDAYLNEVIELDRYKTEMATLKNRREALQHAAEEMERRHRQTEDSQKAIEHIDLFCRQMAKGLENLTFEERQQLLRLVIERVTIQAGRVHVQCIIPNGGDDGHLCTRHPECSGAERRVSRIRPGDASQRLSMTIGRVFDCNRSQLLKRIERPIGQCRGRRRKLLHRKRLS